MKAFENIGDHFAAAERRNREAQEMLDSVTTAKRAAAKRDPQADRFAETARAVAKTSEQRWTPNAFDATGTPRTSGR